MQLHEIDLPLLEELVGKPAACLVTREVTGERRGGELITVSTACSRIHVVLAGTRKAFHREQTGRAS